MELNSIAGGVPIFNPSRADVTDTSLVIFRNIKNLAILQLAVYPHSSARIIRLPEPQFEMKNQKFVIEVPRIQL